MPKPRFFLPEIHRLRGVAMLGVVLLHALSDALVVDPARAGFPWRWGWAVVDTLFHGITTVFVLVTGLLFMRVYADRPVLAFWRRRLGRIGVPYLFVSLVFTPLGVGRLARHGPSPHTLAEFPAAYARNLLLGQAQYQYWFVPVLIILMLLAPVVARILRSRAGGLLLAAAALTPFVVHRSYSNDALPTVVHYECAFILGAWWGAHYEAVEGWIRRNRGILWTVVTVTSAGLTALYAAGEQPDRPGSILESLFWVQKVGAAALLSDVLSRVRRGIVERALSLVGQHAFTVFLLHAAVLGFTVPRALALFGGRPGFLLTVAVATAAATLAAVASTTAPMVLERVAPGTAGWLLGAGNPVNLPASRPAEPAESSAPAPS